MNLDGEIFYDENLVEKKHLREEEKFAGRPEIDRKKLMEMLYENLKTDAIAFGKKLERVVASSTQEAKYVLHFVNGSSRPGVDLVVGADGAWSKVCNILTDVKPSYSGMSLVDVKALYIDSNP